MAKGIRTWLCLAAVCLLAAFGRIQAEETGGAGLAAAERTESAYMEIHAGNEAFRVTLEDNDSVRALRALIGKGERRFPASDYGGFEKVVDLGSHFHAMTRRSPRVPATCSSTRGAGS